MTRDTLRISLAEIDHSHCTRLADEPIHRSCDICAIHASIARGSITPIDVDAYFARTGVPNVTAAAVPTRRLMVARCVVVAVVLIAIARTNLLTRSRSEHETLIAGAVVRVRASVCAVTVSTTRNAGTVIDVVTDFTVAVVSGRTT